VIHYTGRQGKTMAGSAFTQRTAGDREAGARCPHCSSLIAYGEDVAGCVRCGAVHHVACWHSHDGCGSFDCAPARRILGENRPAALQVTDEEVAQAQLRPRPTVGPTFVSLPGAPDVPVGWSRLAIAALIVAVAGIPLFGVVTGLVAVLLGSLALGGIHHTRRRGTGLAVTAILLGLADAVGWMIFLAMFFSTPHLTIGLNEFEPDADALNHMSPPVARAVRANVLIETRSKSALLGGIGIGSGVILQIENGSALIVTNRHVVDPDFRGEGLSEAQKGLPDGRLQVKLIGQAAQAGRVVWMAPDGIDLALITVPSEGDGAQAASWQPKRELIVGADVFSIGNPQHLDWTHTRGSISQLRLQRRGAREIHVIQTDAPLNPGNSGGGLYEKEGTLIGINTWTNDKRFSEGLGFAIALDSLLDLDPPALRPIVKRAAAPHPEKVPP
jgi:S1-C subfamily serine protease